MKGFTDRNKFPFLREAALVAMESMCRNASSTFLEFPLWVLVIHGDKSCEMSSTS